MWGATGYNVRSLLLNVNRESKQMQQGNGSNTGLRHRGPLRDLQRRPQEHIPEAASQERGRAFLLPQTLYATKTKLGHFPG